MNTTNTTNTLQALALARAAAWDAMMKTPGGTPERRAARRAWQRAKAAHQVAK